MNLQPDTATRRFEAEEIQRLIQAGNPELALQRCQAAIDAGVEPVRARLLLAACRHRLGEPELAVQALRQAAELHPAPELREQIANAMVQLRDYKAAWPVIQKLDFSRPSAVLLQARCRWGLGQHQAATGQLEALSGILAEWPALALSHARMLVNLDRHRQALARLETALAAHPEETSLAHQKALLLISLEGIDAAANWLSDRPNPAGPLRRLLEAIEFIAGRRDAEPDHQGPDWEGLRTLLAEPGRPKWFGDNVALLRHACSQAPEHGALIECGVYHGRTVTLLANWASGRQVHGFDSFQGLPEAWSASEPAGSYSTGGQLPAVPETVQLVPGWFAETLPEFAATLEAPIALLHVDCDLYRSAVDVLDALGPKLAPGSIVVFDEYTGYAGWREHEYRAWQEHLRATGTRARLIGAQLLGQSAAFEISTDGCARS